MYKQVIIILILICIGLFVYCSICEKSIEHKLKEEKYHEIIKFESQGQPIKNNYYVLTDNDNQDIIRGNEYPLKNNYRKRTTNMKRPFKERGVIMPKLQSDGIQIKPYGYISEVPDINEYIHSFDYNTGHKVLNGFDIYNTRGMSDINISGLNSYNVNDFYKPYDFKYKPIVNSSVYPLRDSEVELKNGMITSTYPNVCALYGSSNLPDNINMYFQSTWCNIGILSNNNAVQPFTILNLYAQFRGGGLPWRYRIYNKLTDSYVYLPENTRGSGSYGALRDGDVVSNIPGFNGSWICQVQKDRTYIFESN